MEEIKIGDKTYKFKPVGYGEFLDTIESGNPPTTIWWLEKSVVEPKLTKEDIRNMTVKEGTELTQAVMKFNGLGEDFTKVQPSKTTGE